MQPLWAQQNCFINVGIPFENLKSEKDTLVRQIQCGPPALTQAQRKCRLQRAMLSFSLASLPLSLSHLCLAGGQNGREMAFGGINRVGEDWKKMTMEINGNGGSKYFSILLLNTYRWIKGVLKVSSSHSGVLFNSIFIHGLMQTYLSHCESIFSTVSGCSQVFLTISTCSFCITIYTGCANL